VCESALLRLESRENFVSPLGVSVRVCYCMSVVAMGTTELVKGVVCVCVLPPTTFLQLCNVDFHHRGRVLLCTCSAC
jgi:hypothetical protein